MMHQDRFRVAIAMTCADCGEPVPAGEKGAECRHCKRWPLCAKCLGKQHDSKHRFEKIYNDGGLDLLPFGGTYPVGRF